MTFAEILANPSSIEFQALHDAVTQCDENQTDDVTDVLDDVPKDRRTPNVRTDGEEIRFQVEVAKARAIRHMLMMLDAIAAS